MAVTVIVGAQWGDEGKGKIVDLLSENVDIVARYQGGPNAGHTVVIEGQELILHQIPSGILRPHTICVIGNGVVVDPKVLQDEIDFIESKGIEIGNRLLISERAHIITSYHRIKIPLGSHGGQVLAEPLKGLIFVFRVLISDSLSASYVDQGLEHTVSCNSRSLEQPCRFSFPFCQDGKQNVFKAYILVFHLVCFNKGLVQNGQSHRGRYRFCA